MNLGTRLGVARHTVAALAEQPALVRVVAALVCRWMGSSMAMVAYLVVAYVAQGTVGVAILGIARMVPAALTAPLAGPVSQRVGHERLLVLAYGARVAAGVLATAAVALGLPVAVVFLSAAASAAAGALVRPLHAAMLPAVAQTPEQLVAANVASSIGEGAAILAGPALGGVLLAVGGPALALGVAAGIALAGAVLAGTARATHHERRWGSRATRPTSPLRDAVATLRQHPGSFLIVAGFGAQAVVRGLLTTLIVVLSIDLLGMGNAGVGLLTAAIGAGGLAGALVSVSRAPGRSMTTAFGVSLACWGLPIAFVAVMPVTWVAVGALCLVGLSNAALDVAGFTLLQRTIPTTARVSVLGLLEGVVGVGIATGSLISPVLVGALGIRSALVATGAILPIVAAFVWPRLSRVDDVSIVPERQLAVLRRVPLFAPLSLSALEDLARAAAPVSFAAGDVLMREGEPGDRYLVLTAGAVEVVQDGRPVRTCGPGEGVGEIALLRRVPRTATVRATAPTTTYALDAEAFVGAVTGHDIAAAAAEWLVSERLGASPA